MEFHIYRIVTNGMCLTFSQEREERQNWATSRYRVGGQGRDRCQVPNVDFSVKGSFNLSLKIVRG
jgi:hypothetical protein